MALPSFVAFFLFLLVSVKAETSSNGCTCTSSCTTLISGVVATCYVDQSVCGCPHCLGARACAFGKCTPCAGQCYDTCTPAPNPIASWVDKLTGGLNSLIADASALSSDLQSLLKDEIDALAPEIQSLISSSENFARATMSDLDKIGEDVLSHLKWVNQINGTVLAQLTRRLQGFGVSNLQAFLNSITNSAFKEAVGTLGCGEFTPDQLALLGKKAVSVFGAVTGWDVARLREIGQLALGVSQGDLSQLQPLVFKSSVLIFSAATGLKPAQTEALFTKAIEAYGVVSKWRVEDFQRMGKIVTGMKPADIAAVSLEGLAEITKSTGWDTTQIQAIASRALQLLGAIDKLNQTSWKQVGSFAVGLSSTQLGAMSLDGVGFFSRFTGFDTNQARAIFSRVTTVVGSVSTWNATTWQIIGTQAKGILTSEIGTLGPVGVKLLATVTGLSTDQTNALFLRLVALKGSPDKWAVGNGWEIAKNLGGAFTPSYVSALNLNDLKQLSSLQSLKTTVQDAMIARVKALSGGSSSWNTGTLEVLGSAVLRLGPGDIATMGKGLLPALGRVQGWSPDQLTAIVSAVQTRFGQIASLDQGTLLSFGSLAPALIVSHLETLSAEDLGKIGQLTGWNPNQLNSLRGRLLALLTPVASWTSADWSKVGKLAKALTSGDLSTIQNMALSFLSAQTPTNCSALSPACGSSDNGWTSLLPGPLDSTVDWCPDQYLAIGQRLLVLLGPLATWTSTDFKNAGNLVRSMSPTDLASLTIQGLELTEQVTCWDLSQQKCMARTALKLFRAGQGLASWTTSDFQRARHYLTGLTGADLAQMTGAQFKSVLPQLASASGWDQSQLFSLAQQAISAYGPVSQWSASLVSSLQPIIAGLSVADLQSLSPRAVASLAPEVFAVLSDQGKAHSLTTSQISALSAEQVLQISSSEMALMTSSEYSAAVSASSSSSSSNAGVIAGAIIAVLIVLILVFVAVIVYKRRRRGSTRDPSTSSVNRIAPRDPPARPHRPPPPSKLSLVPKLTWRMYSTPAGENYYYCEETEQTTWNKPQDLDTFV